MGRKSPADNKQVEEAPKNDEILKSESETVDPPVVEAMKAVDDKYLAIERELEKEIEKLRKQYKSKLDPLIAERKIILDAPSSEGQSGEEVLATPACKGFWFTALKRLPSTTDEIEEHDEPVLEYLSDVRTVDLDPDDVQKGFKVEFEFIENPFFTNKLLSVELHTKEKNPFSKDMSCTQIQSTEIDWKAGKNVTVEKIAKKVKGGGAKKKKAKETEEPRDSFFRSIFRNLKLGDGIPDDINTEELDMDDADDFMEEYLDNQLEIMKMAKEFLVPHAVRVYTGEAFPDMEDDDDDGDDDEEDDEDDDEEDDDESEEIPATRIKGAAKMKAARAGVEAGQKEECKQQ